jgi:peptide subunit release factor 1 (eRF1)
VVDQYQRDEERSLVAEVFEKEAAGGNATVGLEDTLWAGSLAAIQRLLVQEDATAPGVVCDESGWLAESGDTCLICGQPTRKTDDVVDELTQAVIDTGGTVEHVIADTPLRDQVAAADLRYPLPPKPDDQT